MSWNIRYFHFNIADYGLAWDGTSLSLGAGVYPIAGDYAPAEFAALAAAGPPGHVQIDYGTTTLEGPDGTPKRVLAMSGLAQPSFLDGGVPIPHGPTDNVVVFFLLEGGTVAITQFWNFSPGDFTGILPDEMVINAGPFVLDEQSVSFIQGTHFSNSFDGIGGLTCFTAGTLIATPCGPAPVETIRPGDRVLTRDRGYRPVCWVGQTRVSGRRLATAERLRPIRIAAGALAPGVPARDLVVSPQHRMLLTGPDIERRFGMAEVLAAAKHLVGRPGIEAVLPEGGLTYVHLLLDTHEVLLADGAWSESLYTGPQTMKMLPAAQRAEIFTLFPDLRDATTAHAAPARRFLTGREVRELWQSVPVPA